LVVVCAAGLALAGGSEDKPERIHPRLSAEDALTAWELEARHVADKLDLSDEKADQLAGAFVETKRRLAKTGMQRRQEVRAEFDALRAKIADPGSMPADLSESEREELRETLSALIDEKMQARAEERGKERDRFAESIGVFLSETETEAVVGRLGSFSGQWDCMVDTIAKFNLGEKQATALEAINTYFIEYAKLRETAFGESDEDFVELCEKLISIKAIRERSIAALLTEDQFAKWQEGVRLRGPGRGPRALLGEEEAEGSGSHEEE
jgi:hypothetical protein